MSDLPEDHFRNGLWKQTDFKENGFGIDPEGCGCTDCLISYAFHPSETYRLKEAIRQGRTLYNRTGHEVILPNGYRLADDQAWRAGMTLHDCPGCRCNEF